MINVFKKIVSYCPHPPKSPNLTPNYYNNLWLSFHIRDFWSSIDGLIGLIILYTLLFAVSFIKLPIIGRAEYYELVLSRIGIAIMLSLAITYVYTKWRGIQFLELTISKAKFSIVQSLLAIFIWASLWLLVGKLTNTYLLIDTGRFVTMPFALTVGFIGSLFVYAYCMPKFVRGLNPILGVLLSSIFGSLLFLAVSIDFPLYFLPVIILLVYISVRSGSVLGPILAATFLFGSSYVYFAMPVWIVATRHQIYWFMTIVSVVSTVLAGIFLYKFVHPRLLGAIEFE